MSASRPARAPTTARPAPSATPSVNVDPMRHSFVVRLRDGSSVHIRPVVTDDLNAIREFLGLLSRESVGLRLFGAVDLDWASRWAVDVHAEDRYGLVAIADPGQTIIGHGSYVREDADRAEMSFVVADAFHKVGIATILLRRLVAFAKTHGIAVLTAVVLPNNHPMTSVCADSGYPVNFRTLHGETHVELTTSLVYVEPWPSGGWAVKLVNHATPISRHDTEDEARHRAASYERGLVNEEREPRRIGPPSR